MSVEIRGYSPVDDHAACRNLWVEMTLSHQRLYDDVDHGGGVDPGAAFEEYLTKLNLSGMWVAVDGDAVVGFAGLLIQGRQGEVEPLVVTESQRDHGIGTALIDRVTDEASRRGLSQLTVHPAARNVAGLKCVHDAGFTALSRVTLTKDLRGDGLAKHGDVELHGMRFDC